MPAKRKPSKPIRKTTKGKGANYRTAKAGAGMTKKGVAAYRKLIPDPSSRLRLQVRLKREAKLRVGVNHFVRDPKVGRVKEVKQPEPAGSVNSNSSLIERPGVYGTQLSSL